MVSTRSAERPSPFRAMRVSRPAGSARLPRSRREVRADALGGGVRRARARRRRRWSGRRRGRCTTSTPTSTSASATSSCGDWSLRDPGSVSTFATADWVPTQWLPQMVMAQTEDWFGLAGVAWLSGLLVPGPRAGRCTWACRRQAEPLVARRSSSLVALRACTAGLVDAAAACSATSSSSSPPRAWLRARETAGRRWLAGATHLGVDDVPRHVAGRDRHRRWSRWPGWRSTGATPARRSCGCSPCRSLSALAVAADPGRARACSARCSR